MPAKTEEFHPENYFQFNLEDLMWEHRVKSINELSEKTKISRPTLTAMKKGTLRMISLSTIYTLCKEFGCGIDDLIQLKK